MRVLVTEDDEVLAAAVAAGLRREGMAVDIALDGGAALEHAGGQPIRRGGAGPATCPVCTVTRVPAPWRASRRARVLMLTAARSVRDRVEGLDLGADDYLPKPLISPSWWPDAGSRPGRTAGAPLPARLERGDLSLDPARRIAVAPGGACRSPPKELAVLECLLAADGRPVPAEELLERVWDEAAEPFTSTVKTTSAGSGPSSATRR